MILEAACVFFVVVLLGFILYYLLVWQIEKHTRLFDDLDFFHGDDMPRPPEDEDEDNG